MVSKASLGGLHLVSMTLHNQKVNAFQMPGMANFMPVAFTMS
jgi:hypothetical protein